MPETFRVVRSPLFSRVQLSLSRPYLRIEHAVADMGDGVVVSGDGERLVAFHERHWRVVESRGRRGVSLSHG